MKFYPNTATAVITILEKVFIEKSYADKVIEHVLKNNTKWGSRDRKFVAECAYDIIRWKRLMEAIIQKRAEDKEGFWELFGAWCFLNRYPIPDWEPLRKLNPDKMNLAYTRASKEFKTRESIPDWMDQLGRAELKDRWEPELEAMNTKAEVVIRVNTLKIARTILQKELQAQDVQTTTIHGFPDALVLERRQNIFRLPQFKSGYFEMQDAASQAVSRYLDIQPGMRVIDACAGSGGKSLHLAALLQNKGRVISLDLEKWKLDELKKRAARGGATNIETKVIESSKTIKRLAESADRLLLDVPCSGMGVLRRNPDAKWKLSEAFIEQVKTAQHEILSKYCEMLKPGGLMVYSTCSLLPSENRAQIDRFLEANSGNYTLVKDQNLWPSQGFDGFYMALIQKGTTSKHPKT